MSKLLLPYAYDSKGELVHIDEAHKNEKYTCPTCGTELLLRISNIPEGKKYHRQNHFAHKSGTDNHCSESFLHKLFKEKAVEYIEEMIAKGGELPFRWLCDKCDEHHSGNLLKKAVKVAEEHTLESCRPDIALFNKNGEVIIVIEIVVTHKPEPETMKYYDDNKIACIQIKVESFDDCDIIDYKIANPDKVNICPNPVCEKCNNRKNSRKFIITEAPCMKCGRNMRIAMIKNIEGTKKIKWAEFYGPEKFTIEEIETAKQNGVYIEKQYDKSIKESYNANICNHCKEFIDKYSLFRYYNKNKIKEEIEYECNYCKKREEEIERDRIETEKELSKVLDKLNIVERFELCPKCGGLLRVLYGQFGYFWRCENNPRCRYMKDIG